MLEIKLINVCKRDPRSYREIRAFRGHMRLHYIVPSIADYIIEQHSLYTFHIKYFITMNESHQESGLYIYHTACQFRRFEKNISMDA